MAFFSCFPSSLLWLQRFHPAFLIGSKTFYTQFLWIGSSFYYLLYCSVVFPHAYNVLSHLIQDFRCYLPLISSLYLFYTHIIPFFSLFSQWFFGIFNC